MPRVSENCSDGASGSVNVPEGANVSEDVMANLSDKFGKLSSPSRTTKRSALSNSATIASTSSSHSASESEMLDFTSATAALVPSPPSDINQNNFSESSSAAALSMEVVQELINAGARISIPRGGTVTATTNQVASTGVASLPQQDVPSFHIHYVNDLFRKEVEDIINALKKGENLEEDDNYDMTCCASCGIAEDDDIKLKECTACKSVRYCSVKCQKEHRSQHKTLCMKRAAKLRDEILFKQPENTHMGDCPICCVPLTICGKKTFMIECCSKLICNGCDYANLIREREQKIEHKCPFCRHPLPKSHEEAVRNLKKRIEANDPFALNLMGLKRFRDGDYKSAFEYWTKAAELGHVDACYHLGKMYAGGEGVEKDKKKRLYYLEEAAIGGHPFARLDLGGIEENNGRMDRAVKHLIIAANLGHDESLENLKKIYKAGLMSKEDLAAALRGYQAAVNAMKSPQREAADANRFRC